MIFFLAKWEKMNSWDLLAKSYKNTFLFIIDLAKHVREDASNIFQSKNIKMHF